MPKIIEDIVIRNQDNSDSPRNKKSTVDDSYNAVSSKIEESSFAKDKEERDREHLNEPIYRTNRPKYRPLREETKQKKSGVWIFATIAIIASFVGLGTLLSEAKVVVTPKQEVLNLNSDTFSAILNSGTETNIPFQFISVSDSITEEIDFTESEEKETKASGKITVYNEYSSAPQKLIATTRFESTDGLVYMIDEPITVPGTTTKNGVVTPGSVEVTVYAEKTGGTYNKEPSDFTIPGFKGTAKYSKFYARSTTPITGGSTGIVYYLSPEKDSEIQSRLNQSLKERLTERINTEIPKDLIILQNAFVYEPSKTTTERIESSSEKGEYTVQATMGAYALSKDDLAKQIALRMGVLSSSIETEGVTLTEYSNLVLTPSQVIGMTPPQTWTFTLSGNVTVSSLIDENEIAKALAGKTKKESKVKLSEFSSVEKADVILSPFWRRNLPEDSDSIVVETKT